MIIGITGTNGAGKGTVVEYLVEKGFTHYSVRQELTDELARRGLPTDRPHLGALGDELREKNGAGYFCHLFVDRAKAEGINDLVVESIRSLGEVAALKELGGILLAVDAGRKLRYERVVLRGSSTDKVDFDTWVAQEEHEWRTMDPRGMNVPEVMKLADYTLTNDGTLAELHAQLDGILKKIRK